MQISPLSLPLPFKLSQVNAVVVRGRRGVFVVDAGLDTAAARQALVEGLRSLGLRPEQIEAVVVTHFHGDHWGLCPWLQSLGARVLMPELDHELLQRWAAHPEYDARVVEVYRGHGAPEEALQRAAGAMAGMRRLSPPFFADRLIQPGEELELGGEPLRVIAAPGHTPGQICLEHLPTRTLFAGDHILPLITPNISVTHHLADEDPLRDYLASLGRLRGRGFGPTYPAHGPPMPEGPDARIDALLAHHVERTERVLQRVAAGEASCFEVTAHLFRLETLDGWETLMALGETLAHLRALQGEGRLTPRTRGGQITFARE